MGERVYEDGDARDGIAALQCAAQFGAKDGAQDVTPAQVAAVLEHARRLTPQPRELGGAEEDETHHQPGYAVEREIAALSEVAPRWRGAGENRRNPRQHRQRPADVSLAAVLCEMFASWCFHGLDYRAAGAL